MAGLGKQGAARRGGGQLSVLLLVSLPSDKQTQTSANGGTLPLAQESHGSMSVNNVPLPEGHVEHNVESSSTRRKRGPTQNIALAKKKQVGEKLNVEMPEELGRIVGLECQPLTTELGCIVRKHAPLQVTKWAKIDKADRESLLQMAKESFNLHDEQVKDLTFAQMNTQYRNHRHKLHKNYFLPHPTTEVTMQHPPPGVPQEDWNYLCSYFSSDEFKKRSAQNARNRAMQNTPHVIGTKSFARMGVEMTAQTGEVLGPIELYRITHYSNKKHSWEQMVELQSHPVGENEAPVCEEEICSEVLGHKSGYIRGCGHGPKPNRSLSKHHDKSELEAANKRANELEEKLNAQQKDMEVIKATQKATNEILQALMEQMQGATQNATNEIFQALMKQMQDERHMSAHAIAPALDPLSW
ncbi:unnamed protein product [Ilex paraguariensis]|uniref:Transposase, Ptta/En/Spm, plant n=1 Tax=Ilex paraguariensis TaxID=185542 RepID=A0ABC8SB72_9AQUA